MKAELINPFIDATLKVIETMANMSPVAGKPELKQDRSTWGVVTGIIGLGSKQTSGNMLLSFSEGAVLAIVKGMLGVQYATVNDEVADAVGELTNMVSGASKSALSELGYDFDMAIPAVIQGKRVEVTQITKGPVITVPFELPEGKFVVEANLLEHS